MGKRYAGVLVRPRTRQNLAGKFVPKFKMSGFRTLRPKEEVEEGDFRWSRAKKCYVPISKSRVGEMAGTIYTFVRRVAEMSRVITLPEGYRYLAPKNRIKRGDLFWATWHKSYLPVLPSFIGQKVGLITSVIRKVK